MHISSHIRVKIQEFCDVHHTIIINYQALSTFYFILSHLFYSICLDNTAHHLPSEQHISVDNATSKNVKPTNDSKIVIFVNSFASFRRIFEFHYTRQYLKQKIKSTL
jgi:hypothetical protein